MRLDCRPFEINVELIISQFSGVEIEKNLDNGFWLIVFQIKSQINKNKFELVSF